MKAILLLLIGILIGYVLGFHDAATHDEMIFSRAVHGVGGSTRGKLKTDVDRQLDSLSH